MEKINFETLSENCERIARKDIRFNGYNWKAHRYLYTAMKTFESHEAIESFALACEIVIEGQSYDGIVMMHRDGRVYPMMRETYNEIYGNEVYA